MTHKRPLIGILTEGRTDVEAVENYYDDYYSTPALYVDAVRRAGGTAMLLPSGEPHHGDWLRVLDGIIFTGGTDMDPKYYKGNPEHPNQLKASTERDETELALLKALQTRKDIPVLFICRGMQVLNVALGGDLLQHIPDLHPGDIHRNADGGWTRQPVAVDPDSKLADVMDCTEVDTFSGHHQAISRVAPALRAVAHAPDGIVEALEDPNHPFFLAVQWHPELSAETDKSQQNLFDALIRAATKS
ncbi:MAG: gamma-glutamyl-gamma-aminobutyrate hydrolase family protein [Rhodobacteraceae bacterium]|nr:gamma-glutamyl-gamma-aminobutyrate hydrolase family protein [Paracoccaceae bacterium]